MNNIDDIYKFFPGTEYYPYQKDAIAAIYQAFLEGAEYVICEAPWGVGKTYIAKTFADFFNKSYYMTATIGLQNQVLGSFKDVRKIDGRGNNPCLINPKIMANVADCVTKADLFKCPHKPERRQDVSRPEFQLPPAPLCMYWDKKIDAINAHTSVHNYDYIITELTNVKHFSYPRSDSNNLRELSLGIFDEAHNIESKIMEHYDITLSQSRLLEYEITIPEDYTTKTQWIDWLNKIKFDKLEPALVKLKDEMKEEMPDRDKIKVVRRFENLSSLIQRINSLINTYTQNPNAWTFQYKENALKVLPNKVDAFVEHRLFKYFDRKLFLSATILNPRSFAADLGLTGKRVKYVSVPCPFPITNRLIYPLNVGKLGYEDRSANMRVAVEAIKIILDMFPDKKGLLHTNSFTINNAILDSIPMSSPQRQRMISHRGGEGSKGYRDALEEHKEADYPSLLVTPSATEGVDLAGKLSEFQIVFSLFYANEEESPQLKERHTYDPEHRERLACIKLEQATGRSIRGMTEICPTFILDSRFGYFKQRNEGLLSAWWKAAVVPTPHKYLTIITEEAKRRANFMTAGVIR